MEVRVLREVGEKVSMYIARTYFLVLCMWAVSFSSLFVRQRLCLCPPSDTNVRLTFYGVQCGITLESVE